MSKAKSRVSLVRPPPRNLLGSVKPLPGFSMLSHKFPSNRLPHSHCDSHPNCSFHWSLSNHRASQSYPRKPKNPPRAILLCQDAEPSSVTPAHNPNCLETHPQGRHLSTSSSLVPSWAPSPFPGLPCPVPSVSFTHLLIRVQSTVQTLPTDGARESKRQARSHSPERNTPKGGSTARKKNEGQKGG